MTIKSKKSEDRYDYDEADQIAWRAEAAAMTFGDVIKTHRQCENWSQVDTARKLGMSKQHLSNYERGRTFPSLEKANEMALLLGIHPEYLIKKLINDQLKRSNLSMKVTKIESIAS